MTPNNLLLSLKLSFQFYKQLIISSASLTLILIFLENLIEVIFLVKIFIIGLIFLHKRFLESRDSLLFYKNFGITPLFLFTYCLFTDLILSLLIYKLSLLI